MNLSGGHQPATCFAPKKRWRKIRSQLSFKPPTFCQKTEGSWSSMLLSLSLLSSTCEQLPCQSLQRGWPACGTSWRHGGHRSIWVVTELTKKEAWFRYGPLPRIIFHQPRFPWNKRISLPGRLRCSLYFDRKDLSSSRWKRRSWLKDMHSELTDFIDKNNLKSLKLCQQMFQVTVIIRWAW